MKGVLAILDGPVRVGEERVLAVGAGHFPLEPWQVSAGGGTERPQTEFGEQSEVECILEIRDYRNEGKDGLAVCTIEIGDVVLVRVLEVFNPSKERPQLEGHRQYVATGVGFDVSGRKAPCGQIRI